ncbi:MAG: helix-turn-helix transcriptional regulator [Clostridia bacterium]|nr:helix-turn-helix transcriptional regulator [Clostridia bacterium]
MNNSAIGSSWEELEKELFTPEEIAASDLRVALIGEMIKAREGHGLTQRDMEKLSGVAQPVIARMEKGKTSPSIDTVLKLLVPLGMTLKVAPIAEAK